MPVRASGGARAWDLHGSAVAGLGSRATALRKKILEQVEHDEPG